MNRIWTPEEDDVIRADSLAGVARRITAAKLDRPVPATFNRAIKLAAIVQVHKPWTADEVAILRAAFDVEGPLPTDPELAAMVGRNVVQIRFKLAELGLVGLRRHRSGFKRSAEVTERRRASSATCKVGTKTKDEAAARAERRAARLERRRVESEELAARKAARVQAREAADAARVEAVRVRAEAAVERVRLRDAAKAARPPKVERVRMTRPPAAPAVRPAGRPSRPLVAAAVDPHAAMRAALDRVAARRIRPVADVDDVEARLMARLGFT